MGDGCVTDVSARCSGLVEPRFCFLRRLATGVPQGEGFRDEEVQKKDRCLTTKRVFS